MSLLAGKKILVTGILNQHSIAYAIAHAVVEQGGQLAITYQNTERLRDKVTRLADKHFPDALILPLDVSSDEQCDAMFTSLQEHWSELDGLVHSVAFAPREALAGNYHDSTTREAFSTALDISAFSLTALAQRAAKIMTQNASIVTLTYLGSSRAIPNYNVMGVAKAALESSVRYLASSLGPSHIRVNAISAGPIKTLASSGIAGIGKMLNAVARQSALQRNITREEVAATAAFLLSQMASGITGEILHVDAGFSITSCNEQASV